MKTPAVLFSCYLASLGLAAAGSLFAYRKAKRVFGRIESLTTQVLVATAQLLESRARPTVPTGAWSPPAATDSRSPTDPDAVDQPLPAPIDRTLLANLYLAGDGLEIGALHNPLAVPPAARVKYVDRMTTPDLRSHYGELKDLPLVEVHIVDDGETLATVAAESQDFVIANHFIEHCQNPLLALVNIFRVLKAGGIAFITIPDKRFTFDQDRPITPFEHLLRDYREGPQASKRGHFEEWARCVDKLDGQAAEERVRYLTDIDYSIHFHVWSQREILELFFELRDLAAIDFDVEVALKLGIELVVVLRKLPSASGGASSAVGTASRTA